MLILLKYTTICEEIASFAYPLNGGVSFQAVLSEKGSIRITQFDPYVRFLNIMRFIPQHFFPFLTFLCGKCRVDDLGVRQPVTNP